MATAASCLPIVPWYWEFSLSAYPLPQANAQTQPYWDGAAAGELRYQCCVACKHVQLIPRSLCEKCHHEKLSWQVSQRDGTVLTFTIVHRAPLPVFREMVPYTIVIVDMDEGFRVMANALPFCRERVKIGARVRVGFQQVQGMALPVVEAAFLDT